MNKTKLLALAAHMERVPGDNYNQNTWHKALSSQEARISPEPIFFGKLRNIGPLYHAVEPLGEFCGTTACVLGHAPYVEGINLKVVSSHVLPGRQKREAKHLDVALIEGLNVVATSFEAGALEFEIPEEHAEVIFGGTDTRSTRHFYTGSPDRTDYDHDDWIGPSVVAAKLREYVATDGASIEESLEYE